MVSVWYSKKRKILTSLQGKTKDWMINTRVDYLYSDKKTLIIIVITNQSIGSLFCESLSLCQEDLKFLAYHIKTKTLSSLWSMNLKETDIDGYRLSSKC